MRERTLRLELTHVRHAACHAGQHPSLRVMHGDVEVGDVGIALFVQEDVVGLQVPVREKGSLASSVDQNPHSTALLPGDATVVPTCG